MTTTSKTVLGIGIVAVLLLIGIYAFRMNSSSTDQVSSDSMLPSGSNTSDAALDQDTASIDADLTAVADDSATVNEGIETHAQAQ